MNNNAQYTGWSRKFILEVLFASLLLAGLYGCPSSTGPSWEEDRSIPFSPDDRAIAYHHREHVYVARTRGDKHRRVFSAGYKAIVSTPHWSPGQRGVVFAVSNDAQENDSGLFTYELWSWPAPKNIWTDKSSIASGDSVELPLNWRPASSRKLVTASFSDKMQLKADALFRWHPDGDRLLFLNTDVHGVQSVQAFNINTGERSIASPITASSLAFSISPQGDNLQVATADADETLLWVGPIGADKGSWRQIENAPGPRFVPELTLEARQVVASKLLYDLRPRLGSWSPDSRWLAHTRIPTGSKNNGNITLVITSTENDEPQRVVALAADNISDLHWRSDGVHLGLISDNSLLLIDPASGSVAEHVGVLEVKQFFGWSEPGDHMAYLIPAEEFDRTTALLPTGHRIAWQSTQRDNLMIAMPDGTLPVSRFNMMNISAARWGNQTAKLSFWATYLPTVLLLPPGDPAAVLDLDEDVIHWYPTDIAEFAHVGHYYLLNEEFQQAVSHYSDVLNRIENSDRKEYPALESSVHLWRAVAKMAWSGTGTARSDLRFVRDHTELENAETNNPSWDQEILRDLVADRNVLSTMLSMGQIQLAIDYAGSIIESDNDARRVQAHCYQAFIYSSVGHHEALTSHVIDGLIPTTLKSLQIPPPLADALFAYYLDLIMSPENLRQLSDSSKIRFGDQLGLLASGNRDTHTKQADELADQAAIFYREANAIQAELDLLRSIVEQ